MFVVILFWIVLSLGYSIYLLKYFQQEEYSSYRFFRWIYPKRVIQNLAMPIICLLILTIIYFVSDQFIVLLNFFAILVSGIRLVVLFSRPSKIPTSYTHRLCRLIFMLVVLHVVIVYVFVNFVSYPMLLIFLSVVFILVPVIISGANLLISPLEKFLRSLYVIKAKNKLKRINPRIIGITGSYGKTSTKFIVSHILSGTLDVLHTPKSYNTLLGVTRTINESLHEGTKFFIVEMGAYKPKEIARICKLTPPSISVVTAIGPQHLERFKSVENITKAKFEIFEALPSSGVAIINIDDPLILNYLKANQEKIPTNKFVYISAHENSQADLYTRDIVQSKKGLEFIIVDNINSLSYKCEARLLGEHNVANILISVAIANQVGVPMQVAVERLKSLDPVQHRLELKNTQKGITIIDDSYNSNPVGAKNAIETLGLFRDNKRILVTPGLVELGEKENECNYELGKTAANNCDTVILVGVKRSEPIQKGLLDSGFDKTELYLVDNFTEATECIDELASPNDTVLLLNDLPDLYSDK